MDHPNTPPSEPATPPAPSSRPSTRPDTRSGTPKGNGVLHSLSPRHLPWLARRNYALELTASASFPFLLAGVETGIATVLVRNAFEPAAQAADQVFLLNWCVAAIGAAKAFANVTSFLWVRLNHGRDKIRFIATLQVSMAVLVMGLALVPRSMAGLLVFTAIVIAARMVWAGFITIRSTVWRANYPREIRAKVTGQTGLVQVLVIGVLGAALGAILEKNDSAYRVLYPVGVLVGAIGLLAWSRIRVRNHKQLLRAEREEEAEERPSFNPVALARVLAGDHAYARYMAGMFCLGLGNLMVPPLLAIVLKERFGLGYLAAMLITHTIPLLLIPLALPHWTRLLQKVHVVRMRTIHAQVFAASHLLFLVAVLAQIEWLLYLAAAVQGLAFAGGMLAWTLGHLDFAPPNKATQYMGVHVTLTGVRGLFAPFLGVGLYKLFETLRPGAGGIVFAVSFTLTVLGALVFYSLVRHLPDRGRKAHDIIEPVPPSKAST